MSANFYQDIYTVVEDAITQMANTSGTIIGLITPLMAAGFGIYVLLIVMSWWKNPPDNHVGEWMMRMVSWTAIFSFGMNIGLYSGYVAPFVNGLGDDLSSAFGVAGTNAGVIQQLFDQYMALLLKIWSDIGWMDVSGTLFAVMASFIILATAIPLLCIAMAYMLLAKIALGILVAIGPLFICMALFPATRQFFSAWTAQCANYILLTVIFCVAVKFVITVNLQVLNMGDPGFVGSISDLFKIAAVNGLFIFVFMNLPALASGLAGGVSITGMMSRGQAGKAAAGLGNSARGAASSAASKIQSVFKKPNSMGG